VADYRTAAGDLRVIVSMIQRHRQYGWSMPVGEWGAIQAEDRKDFRLALNAGNALEIEALLDEMLRGPLSFGLVSVGGDPQNEVPQMVMWRLALWAKVSPSVDIERLRAPDVGSPMTLHVSGSETVVPVMVDTPRFDCYAQRIIQVLPTGAVLEIGCGFGGTALQILRGSPGIQVVLCDIPETLYLAGYWLSKSTDRTVAWWDENPDADVVLLPAHCLEDWTRPVDVVFSAHTFSGLDRASIARYLTWLSGSSARYFYHDDVTETVNGIWLTDRFPEVLASEMVPEGFTERWREKTPWSGLTDRFCEFFYERTVS
jgi:hypothetical protein